MSTNILGRVCTACGQERKNKDKIAYHPATFEPFCSNYYFCENEKHPHSPQNIIANQDKYSNGMIPLLSYEEAKDLYVEWLEANHSNPQKAKKIAKMVKNPMTWRIGSPELAEFLLDLQGELEFTSLSDTIRFCVERMQEERAKKQFKETKIKKDIKEEKVLQEVAKNPLPVQEEKQPEVVSFDF